LRPTRVTIVSGNEASEARRSGRIHTAELKVAKALLQAGPLRDELQSFERHVSESGRTTWGARVGAHDDIVLAVSLAVWWAVRTAQPDFTQGPIPFLDPDVNGWIGGQEPRGYRQ
jgi:hypothetical protein